MAEEKETELATVTTPLVSPTNNNDDAKSPIISVTTPDDNDDDEKKQIVVADEKKTEEEEEEELKLDPNIVPSDYSPQPRLSIAQTVTVPPYTEKRRLSKIEIKKKEKTIDEMTNALINDPKDAIRRYTIDEKKEEEEKYGYIQEQKQPTQKGASDFHTNPELKPMSVCTILIGISPLIFIVLVIIFGLTIYAIASNENEPSQTFIAGPFGDWSNWGGNLQNQQRATTSIINSTNIKSLQKMCDYVQSIKTNNVTNNYGAFGYIATDNQSQNAFFVDSSGYATSISLKNCSQNWQKSLSEVVGTNTTLISKNGVALYRDKYGNKGVLIGTPNGDISSSKCYVLALDQSNGDVIFTLALTPNGNAPTCQTDGFVVDSHYAYGGIYTSSECDNRSNKKSNDIDCKYRGEMIKIDLNLKTVVDRWFSLPDNSQNDGSYYYGAAPYNVPAIFDEYVIFGTGALFGRSQSADECILNGGTLKSNATNACGNDVSNHPIWSCLEPSIHTDSINVINKTDMTHIASKALHGSDMSTENCNLWKNNGNDIKYANCPNDLSNTSDAARMKTIGSGSDVIATAVFEMNDEIYTCVLTKGGMFYVFEVPALNIKWAKKIGPSGKFGGGFYSLAVDTDNFIAILTITGLETNFRVSVSNTFVCQTGYVTAIDLKTGESIWHFVNPFGVYGDECTANDGYDAIDWSVERGGPPCAIPSISSAAPVIIPDIAGKRVPKQSKERATFIAPVTVSNDLVFIPSGTGDVFVVDVLNGQVLKDLSCVNVYNVTDDSYNRPGIAAGITIVRDMVIVYCGDEQYSPSSNGGKVALYKLNL